MKDEDQVEPMDSEDVEVDRDLWKGYIRNATAKLYFCKTYTTMKLDKHYRRVKVITFVGRKSNRLVATEMCKYFINTVDRLAAEEFREVPGSRASINKKTGSKLKAPQPGGGPRKRSFCARNLGQIKKFKIDCRKTPKKRACLARKRWKC